MKMLLYQKYVITTEEAETISKLNTNRDKMSHVIIRILIVSLECSFCRKYKRFLEAMEESQDMLLNKTAKDLGEYKINFCSKNINT